jgi:hypothetical protein
MPDYVPGFTRSARAAGLLVLTLLVLMIHQRTSAHATPGNVPAGQAEPVWCFSRIEDRERYVVLHMAHPQGLTPAEILDAHHMPKAWLEGVSDPVCFTDWRDGASYLFHLNGRIILSKASFHRAMLTYDGNPLSGYLGMPSLPNAGRAIPMPEVWCYSLFTNAAKDTGVYVGHYPGIRPQEMEISPGEQETLPSDIDYAQAERLECFASWLESAQFRTTILARESLGSGAMDAPYAGPIIRERGKAYRVDRFALTPIAAPNAGALLDLNTRPVWCFTIFTGAQNSTATFGHYPDEPLEAVFARVGGPDWVKEAVKNQAAAEETSCYPSWEAAYNSLFIGAKRNYDQYLPENPGEAEYEVVILRHYLGGEWQKAQRPELSAAMTPNPLTLTRIAPTPTITPSPTLSPTPTQTPTRDARLTSQDNAVWCFTHVEDLAHDVVFLMGHPPHMSYAEIRDRYRLPPGLLSRPDRETYCYDSWLDTALFVADLRSAQLRIDRFRPEHRTEAQIGEYQAMIQANLGTLITIGINARAMGRSLGALGRPDQPVWCSSYFSTIHETGGVYLGHYVDQGDDAILTDYGLQRTDGWKREPSGTYCFASWNEATYFQWEITGERAIYTASFIATRKAYPVNAPVPPPRYAVPFGTPAPTPTSTSMPILTPTATRAPAGAALLGENIRGVWCFTVFTGGQGSTATFGHYPGEPMEVVFARVAAPDWVMTVVQNYAAVKETSCYPTWEAAFGGMFIGQQKNLGKRLPEDPTEADYETVILETYLGTDWQGLRRSELSAEDPQPVETARKSGPVWCHYTIANGQNTSTSLVSAYPDMAVEEVLTLGSGFAYLLKQEPVIQKADCFTSWEAAIDAGVQDWRLFDGEALPTKLGEGDYEVLFLRYAFGPDWREKQRTEFSASAPPNPLTLEFIERKDQ